MSNLKQRGVQCESHCSRCGTEIETVNHALFECPPALQTWALSNVLSAIGIFPRESIFYNLDYLFWRINTTSETFSTFPWIIWYLWKAQNEKVFSIIERKPPDIIQIAEAKAKAWEMAETKESIPSMNPQPPRQDIDLEYQCSIDGSWKQTDTFAGLGWFCIHSQTDRCMMGTRNVRRSLTPLHEEAEALLRAMTCMITQEKRSVSFTTDCSDLIKMVNSPHEWPTFSTLFEEIGRYQLMFSTFTLTLIPRSNNVKVDILAKCARIYPFDVVYVKDSPPAWISEPI